jgi:cell division septal protein FtsQ
LEQGKEKKEGEKIYIRKKRRKRRYRRSLLSMIKRGAIWGISIGIAILSIIFALLSYKW